MISSLANYRPFFSSFRHIPPSEYFWQVSSLNMQAEKMCGPGENVYFKQNRDKIGTKSLRDGSQDICKGTESNLGPVAGI